MIAIRLYSLIGGTKGEEEEMRKEKPVALQ